MQFLRDLRLAKGLSLKQAAECIGSNYVSLQRWELGSKVPVSFIPAIRDLYGLTNDEVMALVEKEAS